MRREDASCNAGTEATSHRIRAYQAALGVAVDQVTRAHNVADEIVFLVCAPGCRAVKKIIALTPEGVLPYAAGGVVRDRHLGMSSVSPASLPTWRTPRPTIGCSRSAGG